LNFFHFLSFVEGDLSFVDVAVFLLLLLLPFFRLFVDVVEFRLERFALYRQGDWGFETLLN